MEIVNFISVQTSFLAQSVSDGVNSVFSAVFDSSWGPQFLHSVPSRIVNGCWTAIKSCGEAVVWYWENGLVKAAKKSGEGMIWCWQSRPRQLLTTAASSTIIGSVGAHVGIPYEEEQAAMIRHRLSPMRLGCLLAGTTGIHYLWQTKFFYHPLNSAVAKKIAASGLITALDAAAVSATLINLIVRERDPRDQTGRESQVLGSIWLLYRLLDIAHCWGEASQQLMHGNFAPTAELFGWATCWLPEI